MRCQLQRSPWKLQRSPWNIGLSEDALVGFSDIVWRLKCPELFAVVIPPMIGPLLYTLLYLSISGRVIHDKCKRAYHSVCVQLSQCPFNLVSSTTGVFEIRNDPRLL